MRRDLFLLMIVAIPAVTARGDGKFFVVTDGVPAKIPYQRALLGFHEGVETLLVQSKYEFSRSTEPDTLAWVVPVPGVPDLASLDTEEAAAFFDMISSRSGPRIIPISLCLFIGGTLCNAAAIIVLAIAFLRDLRHPPDTPVQMARSRRIRVGLFACVVSLLAITTLVPALGATQSSEDIEIVRTQRVGIYDVTILRGQTGEAITDWLRRNAFSINDQDRQAFDDYVLRGWCFVAAKVAPSTEVEQTRAAAEGMVAPLLLKFASERPVYPLALTATAGTETEILLYTLSDGKLTCGERLTLRHAEQMEMKPILRFFADLAETEEWPLLRDLPDKPMMLCKFKGRLTPEQMKRDLEFTPSPNNKPYRERLVVW